MQTDDRISQHRNIRISALASSLCISNTALLQNPLKGFFPGTVGREVGSAVHVSKKSRGNADVAIWRAHFENIWANSAEPLGRVTAPNFHGVFDGRSWASECLVLRKAPQGTVQWAMLCSSIVTITEP